MKGVDFGKRCLGRVQIVGWDDFYDVRTRRLIRVLRILENARKQVCYVHRIALLLLILIQQLLGLVVTNVKLFRDEFERANLALVQDQRSDLIENRRCLLGVHRCVEMTLHEFFLHSITPP